MVVMLGTKVTRPALRLVGFCRDDGGTPGPARAGVASPARPFDPPLCRTPTAEYPQRVRLGVHLLLLFVFATGCAQSREQRQFGADWRTSALNAVETQSALMSLSDNVMFSVADACDRVAGNSTRPEARLRCAGIRLGTGLGALAAATGPNPFIGLVDLVTLVMLQRMWLEEPWADEMFDESDRLALRSAFAAAEKSVWDHADRVLTAQQQQELRDMILEWRAANPDRHDLSWVRLQEFATARQAGASGQGAAPNSILALLWIDPAANLTPTTRELQETRLLAERLAFFAKRTPVILGWQIELTAARMVDSGEVRELVQSSSRITQSLSEFSTSAERFASSYERTLDELPKERAAAIEQLDRAVALQLRTFIDNTSSALNTERTAAVEQLGDEFSRGLQAAAGRLATDFDAQTARTLDRMAQILGEQQDQMSSILAGRLAEADAASQRLIDRIAMRLILVIACGALAVACIAFAYRYLIARFAVSRPPGAG